MSNNAVIISQQVISKLGHELEEIRKRALDNVLSKLNHGLIRLDKLEDCNQLAVRLLQWFNFKTVPMKREVLELLLQLAKHPNLAETLNEIGTVKFLTSLRNDLDTSYYSLIDEILEALFMVPFEAEPRHNDHKSDFDRNFTGESEIVNSENNVCQNDNSAQKDVILHNSGHYIGFSFLNLPWIDLSGTDWHVLSSTNDSLKCDDTDTVLNSCNFLNDVVFQDFYPEIFLQKPLILKSLLQIIDSGEKKCKFAALDCISTLVNALITRMAGVIDASMYSVRREQSSVSLNGRPSALGQSDLRLSGDGQDGESSASARQSARNPTSQDDVNTEQDQENTMIQFSLTALSCTAVLFRCCNSEMLIKVAKLANAITDLIGLCITWKIWYDSSELAKEVAAGMLKIFSNYANVILFHYDRCVSTSMMEDVASHIRALTCTAAVWSRLLKITVKLEDVPVIGLAEDNFQALSHLIMDPAISYSFPKMHSFLMSVAELTMPDDFLNCHNVRRVCSSLTDAARFLNHVNAGKYAAEHVKLAESAVLSVDYQPQNLFVNKFISWISEIFVFGSCEYEDLHEPCQVLLKLLAHHMENVKLCAYLTCCKMANNAICAEQAVNPNMQSSRKLFFLVNIDVLLEICCFGTIDRNLQIANAARDIFVHLIKGQFLMEEVMWKIFVENFVRLLPLLSAHVDLQSPLGNCLFQQFDTDNEYLSELVVLQANLRSLFMPGHSLRMKTIPRIAWLLSKADDALYMLPTLKKLDVSTLHGIFMLESQSSLQFYQKDSSSQMNQVWDIAKEETFISPIYVSTIKQLAHFSKDFALQEELQLGNFHLKMLDCLKALLTADLDGAEKYPFHIIVDLVPACVNIMLNVSLFNKCALSQLAGNTEVYHVLLRACLLLSSQKSLHQDVACLLALMLFNEILIFEYMRVDGNITVNIKIPVVVFQRFKFPFPVHCGSLQSGHTNAAVVLNSSKRNARFLLECSMRIYWNLPLYRDVEDMCTVPIFSKNDSCLSLQPLDVELLKAIYPTAVIKDCVKNIHGARSHKCALLAMKTIAVDFFACSQWENIIPLDSPHLQSTISRFLAVKPNSTADREFLRQILQFLNTLVDNSLVMIKNKLSTVVTWMWNMIKIKDGAIQSLLNSAGLEAFSLLHKELLTFISVLLRATPANFSENCEVNDFDVTLASLMRFVLLNLNIAAAPQFYNLASLEAALNCLVHITARPAWSGPLVQVFNVTLHQLVASLIEVVAAFSVGQVGPNRNSFMGRAVIVASTLCLCHTAAEISSTCADEDWVNHWLVYAEQDQHCDIGLSWLLPLWSHWDSEVRIASVCVAVSISSAKNGCVSMAAQLSRHNGGIWELLLGFLLDPTEASLVREQIALLIVNLTANKTIFRTNLNEQTLESSGYVNEMSETSSLFDTLLEVLQLSNFYQHVAMLLSRFYPRIRLRHKIAPNSDLPSGSDVSSLDNGRNNQPLMAMTEMTMDAGTRYSPTFSEISTGSTGSVATSHGNTVPKVIIATPTLLAGILKLVRNLFNHFPSDALYNVKNTRIVHYIFRCVNEIVSDLEKQKCDLGYLMNSNETVYLLNCMLDLLCNLCSADEEICTLVVESSNTMNLIYCLLSDKFYELKLYPKQLVFTMWGLCFKLLTRILQNQNLYSLQQSVINVASENIGIIAGNFEQVFDEYSANKSHYCSCCLKFLGLLFSTEARRIKEERSAVSPDDLVKSKLSLSNLLDASNGDQTFGYQFCDRLMRLLVGIPRSLQSDSNLLMANDIADALQMLLAVSTCAKEKALQDGLLDIILKRFDTIGICISSNTINATKKPQHSNVINLVKDFELHAGILKNFMSGSLHVKTSVSNSGFVITLAKIFPWLEKQGKLVLSAVLSLLCTYTAHCPAASRSLALFGPAHSTRRARAKTKLETPASCSFSFVHVVISICEKEMRCGNNYLLTVAFELMCTLSLVPICREIISMSQFLQSFQHIFVKKLQEIQSQKVLALHWLHLFVNMSFSQEGQEVILNLKDGVDILLEIGASTPCEMQNVALLIIRNLCFHPTGKAKALYTGNFIDTISRIAINGDNNSQKLAISSIWALICNNQKVKVAIKNGKLIHQLSHLLSERGSDHSANRFDARTRDMLNNVMSMLS